MSLAKTLNSRAIAVVMLALLLAVPILAFAQDESPSKVDIFAGYSWESPGKIGVPPVATSGQQIRLNGASGFGTSVTFNFHKHLGLTADFSDHFGKQADTSHIVFGPKLYGTYEHFTPFAEVLMGLTRVAPESGKAANGFGLLAGGGFDLDFSKHFSWRILQVDYVRQQFSAKTSNTTLGVANMDGVRLQTGVVFKLGGGAPPVPPTASCSAAQPAAVQAGEPVSVTVTPGNFNPKHTVTYDWKSTGGKVSAKETSATIDTAGLAPGNYTVTATATDAKKKQNNVASCTSNFTVNEPPKPPVISCGATPASVVTGSPVNLSAQASSPDNRPLTYTWTTSAGRINGTGANVTLDTAGAPVGTVTVNCVATDDRGLNANSSTTVNVQAPPPPPPPPAPAPGSAEAIRQELHQQGRTLLPVHFDTAKATIRIDSQELLTNAAQVLREDPNLFVFVDGYTDNVGGKAYNLDLSRRRAAAVRTWLIQHGIEANRLVSRGFGMSNPVGDNSTDEGRQLNRRVELVTMSDAEKAKAQAAPKAPRKTKR